MLAEKVIKTIPSELQRLRKTPWHILQSEKLRLMPHHRLIIDMLSSDIVKLNPEVTLIRDEIFPSSHSSIKLMNITKRLVPSLLERNRIFHSRFPPELPRHVYILKMLHVVF